MTDDGSSNTTSEFDLANRLLVELLGGVFTTCGISRDMQLVLEAAAGAIYLECSRLDMTGPGGSSSVDCALDPTSVSVLLPLLRQAKVTSASLKQPGDLHVEFDTGHSWQVPSDEYRWDYQGAEVVIEAVPGEGVRVLHGAELGL